MRPAAATVMLSVGMIWMHLHAFASIERSELMSITIQAAQRVCSVFLHLLWFHQGLVLRCAEALKQSREETWAAKAEFDEYKACGTCKS